MSDARIVLVNANVQSQDSAHNSPTEHLGLAYLASYLRVHGYGGVGIIDAYALRLGTEQVLEELRERPPALLGITFEYNTYEEAVRLAAMWKRHAPASRVVVGGEHATYAWDQILRDRPEVDYVIRGEGEVTLLELCEALFAPGGGAAGAGINGLAYRDADGTPKRNADRRALEDLDALPLPARDTLERALEAGAPAADMQAVKDATFQPALDLLNQEGLDIQVFVYDKDAPPLKG